MTRLTLCALALAALAGSPVVSQNPEPSAPDWPSFRGPKRDNLSPDKKLLKAWPKEGPKLLWTGEGVGQGFSSVSLVGDYVYTMGDKDKSSYVFALNRKTGKVEWTSEVVGKAGGNYSGTRGTPTVEGGLLYALGQFGDFVCLDAKTGKEKWRKNFAKDFGGRSGGWNYTESPLIDGDRVVVTPGGKNAGMVALNKTTGEVVWKANFSDSAGYSSVVISNACGIKQYVTLTSGGTVGVAAADGKLLWRFTKLANNTANIPTPIVFGDQVFTAAGYGKGAALLTLVRTGDEIEAKEEYYVTELKNKHGGVLIVGNYVYGDYDDSGRPYCADWKTGRIRWQRTGGKGGPGSGSAAVTYADGFLYVRYQNGWMALVSATADEYTESGSFRIPTSNTNSWAHPVVVGGRMYLREKDKVFCYDVSAN